MGYSQKSITDHLGRTFGTLRVSLTNACNLKCIYCVDPESKPIINKISQTPLDTNRLVQLILSLHKITPFHTVRITGGEPTLNKDLVNFVQKIADAGISNIKMTTNGALIVSKISDLAAAGLSEINFSLDAIDPAIYYSITKRTNIKNTFSAIDAIQKNNIPLKINSVIVKGLTDSQIIPLLNFGITNKITVRFLELMKMGHLFSAQFDKYFFSKKAILSMINSKFHYIEDPRKVGATANYWTINGDYKFGIIANETSPFCKDCDRLRIDNFGNLFGCLSNNIGININKDLSQIELQNNLQLALDQKQLNNFIGSKLNMMAIGG